jgi:ATP-dependent exoDNAse (exonuclease V) beta subunit
MSLLTIYKASAGSGKTFTLTLEYVKLLIDNPRAYRNILAVTFTNKAAAEMKNRIISVLEQLATGKETIYLSLLQESSGYTEMQVRERAQMALSRILHDYTRFSVGTIDSFFQRVIRSFAREAGLQSNFTLELDSSAILNEAIDNLLDRISDDKQLAQWLIQFSLDKMEDNKHWDIRNEMFRLGSNLFNEAFREHDIEKRKVFSDKEFILQYRNLLNSIEQNFDTKLRNLGKRFVELMNAYVLSDSDFRNKSKGIAPALCKMANGQIPNMDTQYMALAAEGVDGWYAKDSKQRAVIEGIYPTELKPLFDSVLELLKNDAVHYETAKMLKGNLYALGLLSDISNEIAEIGQERNQFLLSDTPHFLKAIINGNDASFIYEKTGSQYKNYLLDEFQDTSGLQWINFKPLIQNSLGQGDSCLVVGDVKQSIYRWRNGDWQLLSHKLNEEFSDWVGEVSLDVNRRSDYGVIAFNNSVFELSPQLLQMQLTDLVEPYTTEGHFSRFILPQAYSNACQEFSGTEKQGYVKVEFLQAQKKTEFTELACARAIGVFEDLQRNGVKASDIAFLVRKRSEGEQLAEAMLQYKLTANKPDICYDLISDEVFLLKSSPQVNFLIALLRYFVNKEDQVNNAFLVSEYSLYLNVNAQEMPLPDASADPCTYFPPAFSESLNALQNMPLYECCEKMAAIFSLGHQAEQRPFLNAFFDAMLEYLRYNPADLTMFLTWWDEKGSKLSLPSSDNSKAARVLTIHKSKGLEFHTLIIPFANWEFDNAMVDTILWCAPASEPFNQLPLVPLKYGQQMLKTIFVEEYITEKSQQMLDNLNLLYVALTRARHNLWVFASHNFEKEAKDNKMKSVSDLLWELVNTSLSVKSNSIPRLNFSDFWSAETRTFEWGNLYLSDKKVTTPDSDGIPAFEMDNFHPKLRLKYAFSEWAGQSEDGTVVNLRDKGKLLHSIFASIRHTNELEHTINELIAKGLIPKAEKQLWMDDVQSALVNEQAKAWFSDQWTVRNEVEILIPGGAIRRPDRVITNGLQTLVIDFKFGRKTDPKHLAQVGEYAQLLAQMDYPNVEAYIWYVQLNQIVKADVLN